MGQLTKHINKRVLAGMRQFNTIAVMVKILAEVCITKAIAVFIGAEGFALIGNIRDFLGATQSLSILGFYRGFIKLIAEYRKDVKMLSKTISTALYLGFVATLFISILCYYNAEAINDVLFSATYNYGYVIKILALALPFFSLNMLSFGIMRGFSKNKILTIIYILGQALGILVSLLLIYWENIDGALLAAVISPALVFLITMVGFANQNSLFSSIRLSNVSAQVFNALSPFTIMAIVSAVLLPLVTIVIRNYIIEEVGIKEAGYWEAMNRISEYTFMFVMALFSLYVIPRLRIVGSKTDFINRVKKMGKLIIPALGLGLLLLYLLKVVIVKALFNNDFLPVTELFGWQLLGDFVKLLSAVIAYQFLAKKMVAHFVVIELFLVIVLYLTSVYLIDVFGVTGAVMAHFVSYLMYFGIVVLILSSSLFGILPEKNPN